MPAPSAAVKRVWKSSIAQVESLSPVKWIELRCSAQAPGSAPPWSHIDEPIRDSGSQRSAAVALALRIERVDPGVAGVSPAALARLSSQQ